MEIKVTNVNQCLSECLQWLLAAGVEENSRNGPVLVSPEPVMVTYTCPRERVLFSPLRDANPFFHLQEALWMLAGRNDVEWPAYFASNMRNYSDDGKIFHGAYGYRWRHAMGFDQLKAIVDELIKNKESRRCVLQMWQSGPTMHDLEVAKYGGKDVPCNTQAYFDCRGGVLNMTVMNRSNDLIWGLAGANAVHFSVLLEYMAAWIGIPVGVYRQFTNNLHAYTSTVGSREKMQQLATDAVAQDQYLNGAQTFWLVNTDIAIWNTDLKKFFEDPLRDVVEYNDVFFATVALPMYAAWHARKLNQPLIEQAGWLELIAADDWRIACSDWVARREQKKAMQSA